jgi:hypothetical protein
MPTSNESGKSPEPTTEAFPRRVWLAGVGALLVVGWAFILFVNGFHFTAPVFFVCLGYTAGVAAVYTLFRTGASAATASEEDAEDASWGRPVGARGELEREKKALLKAIKEAEFDLQMGKLSKADAEAMIGSYRAQAIAVIREIDRKDGGDTSVREQIEREVRARLEVAKAKHVTDDKRPQGKKGKKQQAAAEAAQKVDEAADEAADDAEAAAKADEAVAVAVVVGEAATKADEAVAVVVGEAATKADEAVAVVVVAAATEAEAAPVVGEAAEQKDQPEAAPKEATS